MRHPWEKLIHTRVICKELANNKYQIEKIIEDEYRRGLEWCHKNFPYFNVTGDEEVTKEDGSITLDFYLDPRCPHCGELP
jgi:hypothetical protein